jgi:D-sedoheptulose 7-phosphate isomerase
MNQSQSIKLYVTNYFDELKRCLDDLDQETIEKTIDLLLEAYRKGKKVFIIGNGGSASNASHMACDLSKGTLSRVYDDGKKRFKVYSLTDNVAIMTAFANDLSYDAIFVQQLRNLVQSGDIVIALSGSGNSVNIIKAVKYAHKRKAKTIGFLGFKNGGKLGKLVDVAVIVNSNNYGPCEDIQLVLDHVISNWLANLRIGLEKSDKS